MGSDEHYPEERPRRTEHVDGFLIDACTVSNAEFDAFVSATDYITSAEQRNESMVFSLQESAVDLHDHDNWWALVPGANWRNPEGPDSTIIERMDHPVVHVSRDDAKAFATWSGKDLPQEKEWEFAAQKGRINLLPWGVLRSQTKGYDANIWQGQFPFRNTVHGAASFTVPVSALEPNEVGLFNMIGNVWEWTETRVVDSYGPPAKCCAPSPKEQTSQFVLKGGSHLCSPQYCARYRPEARIFMAEDSTTSHIGFRCVIRSTP